MKRIVILGGYGNFGGYVARALASDPEIELLIAGRSGERADSFAQSLSGANRAEGCAVDIRKPLAGILRKLSPDMVIHTVGPFQGQDYAVAEACIRQGCHYADLADARAFVGGIGILEEAAKSRDVLIVAGASSVPCLTAAIVDEALPRFARLHSLDYGISAAQQTNRGLATASSVLSYIGRPFTTLWEGRSRTVYGWQNLHVKRYPELGLRLFGNCDIPDLEIFPKRYRDLLTIRFCAGHEIKVLHLSTWLLSWGVRIGLFPPLGRYAGQLLKLSFFLDFMGSDRSGFHMVLRGVGHDDRERVERMFIIARAGDGPFIPCMPAILLARRLASGQLAERGARPCVDLIDLKAYFEALGDLDVRVIRSTGKG